MARYLLLIYEPESAWMNISESQKQAIMNEYMQLTTSIKQSGHHLGGEALQPVASATTVRVQQGKTTMTHGPFAETREQLGGYYLIQAKNLDEATAIAARIPAARTGSIEIRPLMEFPNP